MNTLSGTIESINVDGQLSLVHILVGTVRLTAVVIDTPQTAPYLQLGHAVQVLFKESEVVMGRSEELPVSLQNRFSGTVASIRSGGLLSKVRLDTPVGPIVSVITNKAVEQLGLREGMPATALIKTNEIMLAAC